MCASVFSFCSGENNWNEKYENSIWNILSIRDVLTVLTQYIDRWMSEIRKKSIRINWKPEKKNVGLFNWFSCFPLPLHFWSSVQCPSSTLSTLFRSPWVIYISKSQSETFNCAVIPCSMFHNRFSSFFLSTRFESVCVFFGFFLWLVVGLANVW